MRRLGKLYHANQSGPNGTDRRLHPQTFFVPHPSLFTVLRPLIIYDIMFACIFTNAILSTASLALEIELYLSNVYHLLSRFDTALARQLSVS